MVSKRKVLIIGSRGFVGRNVKDVLSTQYDVFCADKNTNGSVNSYCIDLLDKKSIANVLKEIKPHIIIDCAGIVDCNNKVMLNPTFTSNLLDEVVACKLIPERIIIMGSAAEYGIVERKNIPVDEETPLNANSAYGLSKLKETTLALEYRSRHKLPITIARIFNPIGVSMHPRFLIPQIIGQIQEIEEGKRKSLEVSRLDTKRDYVSVKDVALAIKSLIGHQPLAAIYNIGSGRSTSNKKLMELIINNSKLKSRPKIVELSAEEPPLVATRADITRIQQEFGWHPIYSIEDTVKEIMYDTKS